MPLPLIPVAIVATSALSALWATFKGGKAIGKNIQAKNINKEAQAILDSAQKNAVSAANKSEERLNALGDTKLQVLDKSVHRFIAVFDKIHEIKLKGSIGLDELGEYRIDKQSVLELRKMSILATETIAGLLGGASAGALTAFGAYGATMTFASASTGTAIATLTGIAAKNATLAFLGGGALAAGGGGIMLGTIVLGSLVVGPAMLVLGVVLDSSAQKNLEKALSNKAEAQVMAEELKLVRTHCNGIAERANMFDVLLRKLDRFFMTLIGQLEYIVSTKGTNYAKYDKAEQNRVAMAMSVAGAVKTVLDTPILNSDGGLTDESQQTHEKITKFLGATQKALDCQEAFKIAPPSASKSTPRWIIQKLSKTLRSFLRQ